ncbi:MAG: AbrB/MazE/SpoVT family DNA-binding domain-containing protein [Terracidiphilus sp.]|jgi:AbrB family looped-hinge helix DNA binding protein|nr:AbrB/MazE/SpoVT family DNA-binding domain-containing protein [Terracidiphilus sp.]
MPSAMVTFNGRITLPPHVRKQLGLKTGDSVEFVEIGNGRFAIATGARSISGSLSEPRSWISDLAFSPTAEEPRFKEPDETIQ